MTFTKLEEKKKAEEVLSKWSYSENESICREARHRGFPYGSAGRESSCKAGNTDSTLGWGRLLGKGCSSRKPTRRPLHREMRAIFSFMAWLPSEAVAASSGSRQLELGAQVGPLHWTSHSSPRA